MKKTFLAAALIGAAAGAWAQATPVGLWKTIDDDGKTEKSLVRIVETGGVLSGKVEKILDPAKQDSKCDKCTGERKDKPVLGLTIIENVKKNPDESYWDGGTITDPNSGTSYKVRMSPKDGGKTMDLRAYIGAPLIGRTQTWIRVE
jgi:uncharacterized protein (DUF2147 family)